MAHVLTYFEILIADMAADIFVQPRGHRLLPINLGYGDKGLKKIHDNQEGEHYSRNSIFVLNIQLNPSLISAVFKR